MDYYFFFKLSITDDEIWTSFVDCTNVNLSVLILSYSYEDANTRAGWVKGTRALPVHFFVTTEESIFQNKKFFKIGI